MNVFLPFIAFLAAGALSFLEWRRPDRRHLAVRLGATLLAVGALAAWGWRQDQQPPAPPATGSADASLWTAGAASTEDHGAAPGKHFALPDASAAPADAMLMPDVATLRRRQPEIGTLHVFGDGFEPFDLDALRGLKVVFHLPANPSQSAQPAFTFVRCPRELPLGEPLSVQGHVSGLKPGGTATVTLEAPDGATADGASAPADANGNAAFSVTGAAPPATGHFTWRLRLGKTGGETLGVAVAAPNLPRVLALAGAPQFDTAALRRWFEAAGGTLTARTLVGQDRYRFESSHDPPPQFAAIDAPLLAGFDLVLADGRTLAALPPPERDALRAAVADNGLGLLLLADDTLAPVAPGVPPGTRAAFFPWKLSPVPDNDERLARVEWPGQARAAEVALPVAPWEFTQPFPDGQTPLMHDGQGRTLAASLALGRGQIALTFVRETGRWTREDDPAAFAAYWSALFSTLARKATPADAGHWTLAGGEARPVFVDQPLELIWTGKELATPGIVTAETGGGEKVSLALAPDAGAGPGHWEGMFWPRQAGWHRVAMPSATGTAAAAALDFFVGPAGSWNALDAARRRMATGRFVEESGDGKGVVAGAMGGGTGTIPAGTWFALFLVGAGYLWMERRQVG